MSMHRVAWATHTPAPADRRCRVELRRRVAALVLAAVSLAPDAWAQSFAISPGPQLLAGAPMQIVLNGLTPGAAVELRATRGVRDDANQMILYAATARFVADAQGRIDLATQAPQAGSYSGADLRGLFWSMQPVKDSTEAAPAPDHVKLDARIAGEATPIATQVIHLLRSLPAVTQRAAPPFPGAVFASLPGEAKRPALIILGGSEGGSAITRDAPVFASRGYAVLALPYYSPGGRGSNGPAPAELPSLPSAFADIPLERLEDARAWLAQRAEVDASRIGVLGTSKGAEFALLAATRMPWIRTVVAIAPTDVVWEGWGPGIEPGQRSSFAWRGKALPFVPYEDFAQEFAGAATGADIIIRRPHDKGRAANPDRVPAARIPVETIAVPVMVAGGHDDKVWDSAGMAEAIAAARGKAGRETLALVYRDAGHVLGGPGLAPTTQYDAGRRKSGGTPQANARAQAEIFAKTLEFLARTLQPESR